MSEHIPNVTSDPVARKAALRELIMQNAVEVGGENEQYLKFFKQMKEDAVAFAETMRGLDVSHDVAVHREITRPGGVLLLPKYDDTEYLIWFVREEKKYGGDNRSLWGGASRSETYAYERLGIMATTGRLALPYADDYGQYESGDFNINPDEEVKAADVVERTAFDTPGRFTELYQEWMNDLEAATRHYAQKS